MLIPKSIVKFFNVSFARSSGKGGQHVNTTDSRAIISLTPHAWTQSRGQWIPENTFDNLMVNYHEKAPGKRFPFFTSKMGVRVSSERSRVRDDNLEDCLVKFCQEVEKCSQLRKEVDEMTKKQWDKLKKRDNERRLMDKKRNSDKKKGRKISLD